MIVGNRTIIKTDHKPLLNIFKKPLLRAPKRLQLMLMALQRYNFEIEYINGKNNMVADVLSRAPTQVSKSDEANADLRANIFKINGEKIDVLKSLEEMNTIPEIDNDWMEEI
ncbi:hypothetical protein QE152_g13533 [Popillia japonica]|uniref:Reverse transcriptase RNase H-like domain-containing protein n=1 Tax=Popillia japonica TaxID=7064 RepID=A0AAW1LCE9_POPJA